MKTLIYRFLDFYRAKEGPTAMESALFFGLVVLLCAVSMKMATNYVSAEPMLGR